MFELFMFVKLLNNEVTCKLFFNRFSIQFCFFGVIFCLLQNSMNLGYAGPSINTPVNTPIEGYPDHLLIDKKKSFRKLNKTYSIYSKLLKVNFITPQSGYLVYQKLQNKPNQPLQKLSVSPGFKPIKNTSLPITQTIDYDYHKPVVVIKVVPRLKMTPATKAMTWASTAAAVALPGAYILGAVPLLAASQLFDRYEYKQSITSVKLMSHDGSFSCEPISSQLSPLDKDHSDFYLRYKPHHLSKKSIQPNLAVYEFDAHCFNQTKPLDLWVLTTQNTLPTRMAISQKLKHQIITDFSPYWAYADKLTKNSAEK